MDSKKFPRDFSIALGSASVSLSELMTAYSVFANGGDLVKPKLIRKITDRNGKVLFDYENESDTVRGVISPETAFLITSILQDVIRRGTGRAAAVIDRPVAGKTPPGIIAVKINPQTGYLACNNPAEDSRFEYFKAGTEPLECDPEEANPAEDTLTAEDPVISDGQEPNPADFIVDARQIRESYDIGADAILLIAACLTEVQLKSFRQIASDFGLSVLVEVHSLEELDMIKKLEFDLIGVNNRNLTDFQVSLETSLKLAAHFPKKAVRVSESGISTPADCRQLFNAGYHAVLIGEHLMKQPSPGQALRALMKY
ncbi:hypothetical protein CHS0354_035336 [Potamilus streckersoni]|uniref:indole-3-glycerol-phosphate synthase n=1 Tax=Potamilus streckersoni TaxID=2493646 RepID=A0AAE0S2X4_9BIVA|nr:hypothetical protein CHS0354_035336 [Potamilus streckersoni]